MRYHGICLKRPGIAVGHQRETVQDAIAADRFTREMVGVGVGFGMGSEVDHLTGTTGGGQEVEVGLTSGLCRMLQFRQDRCAES